MAMSSNYGLRKHLAEPVTVVASGGLNNLPDILLLPEHIFNPKTTLIVEIVWTEWTPALCHWST